MLLNTSQTKYKHFHHGLPQTPGILEDNNNKSFFSGKELSHNIQKNDTIMATKTGINTDMVRINWETLFNKVEFPYAVWVEDLKHMHPYIKSLFCARKIPDKQLAVRWKTFTENWKILTNNTEILSSVEDYTIPFHKIPQQKNIPNSPKLNQEKKILVKKEIHEMLNKGAIVELQTTWKGNLSAIFFL